MLMMSPRTPEPDPIDPEQLLTIQHVAQLLQVSVQTIRNRLDGGQFLPPTHRFGRQIRWRRSDVIAYLQGAQIFSCESLKRKSS